MTTPNVFVVVPVFNRKAITLLCLDQLRSNGDLDWIKVIVVDDNSPDGTAAAIVEHFPEVTILHGDGNLWWAGCIKLGMKHACQNGADFIVWLNDDCHPAPGALCLVVEYAKENGAIALSSPYEGDAYYGGFSKTRFGLRKIPFLPGEFQSCDTFAGNFVCIPRSIVEAIGYPDSDSLPQVFADADYGLRATSAGFSAVVVGPAESWIRSEMHSAARSILRDNVTPPDIVKSWFWKKSSYYAPALWIIRTRHWGAIGAVRFFYELVVPLLLSVWVVCMPGRARLWPSYLRRYFQGKSKTTTAR